MARNPTTQPERPAEKQGTPESIRAALRKIRRSLTDVEEFEPQSFTQVNDPEVSALEISIREMLDDVFGPNSRMHRSYQSAAALDTAGISMGTRTGLSKGIEGLERGKERSITYLRGANQFFERKMEDDFPGEPLDRVALSARSSAVSNGNGVLQGAEARAVSAPEKGKC